MIEREGADTIAAFIGEPVLGTGGIVPPPAGYWEAIQAVLKKHDILLIADEVVTGFGRLGTMMGSKHYGIEPDIITIAKGLTSAYAPLSGSIISEKVWQVLEQGTDNSGPSATAGPTRLTRSVRRQVSPTSSSSTALASSPMPEIPAPISTRA
jgi:L-2,4-diaminobutyrate transaminase